MNETSASKPTVKDTLDTILKIVAVIGIIFGLHAYLDRRYAGREPAGIQGVTHSEDIVINPTALPPTPTLVGWSHIPSNAKINAVWLCVTRGFERLPDFDVLQAVPEADGKVRLHHKAKSPATNGNVHLHVFCSYSK